MANHHVIHMNDINGVTTKLLATFIIVVSRNAGNQNITDLIFSRATYNPWLPSNTLGIVMPGVVVTDGDDGGIDLTQRVPWLRRKGIGDQSNILATQLETSVAVPCNFHKGKDSLFSIVRAGTVVLARI